MPDFFRLKVVSKRQVTLPQLLLERLHIAEGDELEVEVEDGEILAVRPMKLVPANLFSPGMLRKLEERSRDMDAGEKARPYDPVAAVEQRKSQRASVAKEVGADDDVRTSSGA